MRLLVGGILALLGLALVAGRCASSRIEDAGTIDVAGLRALKTGPRTVTLEGVAIDWTHRRYRLGRSGPMFTADPRTVTPIADGTELAARGKELTGRFVRLEHAPVPKSYFYVVKKSRDDGRVLSQDTALYAPVEGTGGAAWIVSEVLSGKDDPRSKDFLARASHVGVVKSAFDVYDGTMLATSFEKSAGKRLPVDAVALDTEAPPGTDSAVTTWAPLADSAKRDMWIALDGAPAEPPSSRAGILEVVQDPLLDGEIGRMVGTGTDYAARRVVWLGDDDSFRAAHPDLSRVSYLGLGLLVAGIGVLVAHALLRRAAA